MKSSLADKVIENYYRVLHDVSDELIDRIKELSLQIKPSIIFRVIPEYSKSVYIISDNTQRNWYCLGWLIFEITFKIRK